eukprot:1158179-Pelagomonas_calceolata.AAC.3
MQSRGGCMHRDAKPSTEMQSQEETECTEMQSQEEAECIKMQSQEETDCMQSQEETGCTEMQSQGETECAEMQSQEETERMKVDATLRVSTAVWRGWAQLGIACKKKIFHNAPILYGINSPAHSTMIKEPGCILTQKTEPDKNTEMLCILRTD